MQKVVKTKVQRIVSDPLHPFSAEFAVYYGDPSKDLHGKMHRVMEAISAELLTDVRLCHSRGLPSAIQVLESVSGEPSLGVISENQITFGQGGVLLEIPSLANLEVPQDVLRRVGLERNCDEGVEQFLCLFEVGICPSEVQESELGKLPEERQVGFQVMNKIGQACLGPLKVCERHHRGREDSLPRHIGNLSTK